MRAPRAPPARARAKSIKSTRALRIHPRKSRHKRAWPVPARAMPIRNTLTRMESNKKVEIYSTPPCQYCRAAKEFFKKHNIQYTDYNVAEDEVKREEMVHRSGQLGVPVIFVGEEMIVGFDEPALKRALNIP